MESTVRVKIGILLTNDDVGAVYYLRSITKTLQYLPPERQPELVILYNQACAKHIYLFDYPHQQIVALPTQNFSLTFLASLWKRRNLFVTPFVEKYRLAGIFPLNILPVGSQNRYIAAAWIPDFQHKFLPHLFSWHNRLIRELRFRLIISQADALVLSSQDVHNHLQKFYGTTSKPAVHVLRFMSMIKDFPLKSEIEIRQKYQLTTPYFVVSNQFYQHKNHLVVLQAIVALTKSWGKNFKVVFTGKTEDYRSPHFFPSLLHFIQQNQIQDQILIAGLIDRSDQLSLLKHALVIVQPSKFEGWSTVIEDAKTLQKPLICSDIAVHREQLANVGYFFNPDYPTELSNLMQQFLDHTANSSAPANNYEKRLEEIADTFVSIFSPTIKSITQ